MEINLVTRPDYVIRKWFVVFYPEFLEFHSTEEEVCTCSLILGVDHSLYHIEYDSPRLIGGLTGLFKYLNEIQRWQKGHYLVALITLDGLKDNCTRKRLVDFVKKGGRVLFLNFGVDMPKRRRLMAMIDKTFKVFLKDLSYFYDNGLGFSYFDVDDKVALGILDPDCIYSGYTFAGGLGRSTREFIADGPWLRDFLAMDSIPTLKISCQVIPSRYRYKIRTSVTNISNSAARNVHVKLHKKRRLLRDCPKKKVLLPKESFNFNCFVSPKRSVDNLWVSSAFSDVEGRRFADSTTRTKFHELMDRIASKTVKTPSWFQQYEAELATKTIDLGIDTAKAATLAIVQPAIESNVYEAYKFKDKIVDAQSENILKLLRNAINKGANVVLFPELSIPEKALPKMSELVGKRKAYVVGGFEYDKMRRNIAKVIAPDESGTVRVFTQAKMSRSPYDCPEMKVKKKLFIFNHSGFGDFAVLICYDFTNPEILATLQGNIDFLLIPSRNKAVGTFHSAAVHNCYQYYCYIAIANVANWGGSGFYAPRKGNRCLKRIEEPVESTLFCKFDVSRLRNAVLHKRKTGDFLYIPSGFTVDRVGSREKVDE